jgi:hypothetical protein
MREHRGLRVIASANRAKGEDAGMWADDDLAACRLALNDAEVALEKLLMTVEGAKPPVRPGDAQRLRAFLGEVDLWERVTTALIRRIRSDAFVWGTWTTEPEAGSPSPPTLTT